MVLVNGMGASVSPLLVSSLMESVGSEAFFSTISVIAFSMFVFALYRMSTSDAVPMEHQGAYILTPMRTSAPMTQTIMKEQDASTPASTSSGAE